MRQQKTNETLSFWGVLQPTSPHLYFALNLLLTYFLGASEERCEADDYDDPH